MPLKVDAYDNEVFEVSDRMLAWADIKESHRIQQVLYAQAIGIEFVTVGERKEECLKLNYGGILGYLPITLIDNYKFKGLQNFLGKRFEFVVEHVDIETQMFVANRIKALELLSKRFWDRVQEGQVYEAFVRGVDPFNLFLLVDGVPAKMTRDEYSYSYIQDLRDEIQIGDVIDVKILRFAKPGEKFEKVNANGSIVESIAGEEGYLSVSRKVLTEDPWNNIVNYHEGCYYLGTIKDIHMDHGIFIELEPGIDVRVNFPPNSSGRLFKRGNQVNVKINQIDVKNRRIKAIIVDPRQNIGKRRFGHRRGLVR